MNKRILVVILLALPFALQAANRGPIQSDWVYLQNGPDVRLSIESYQARQGWTPVVVSLAGTEVSVMMDGRGRAFRKWSAGLNSRGVPLFVIDVERGSLELAGETHAIRVYEQNGVRTRFLLAESAIELPLRMDRQGKEAVLGFGRLDIPARVSGIRFSRTAGNLSEPQTGLASPIMTRERHGIVAQLTPSRIRARGK